MVQKTDNENMFTDTYLIGNIKKTNFLNDETKQRYMRRLDVIQTDIWKTCDNDGHNLHCILRHPDEFMKKIEKRNGKNGYMTAIMALFTYTQTLKEKEFQLYKNWERLSNEMREEKRKHYRKNEPSEEQMKGYIQFDEICKRRDALQKEYRGTPEFLLLQLFTEIPPVRGNDFYATKILLTNDISTITDEEIKKKEAGNCVLISKNLKKATLILQDYKTAKLYNTQRFILPKKIIETLKLIIQKDANRTHLFLSTKKKPYNSRRAFNNWANSIVRKLLENDSFSLTMFRHVYISRPDLDLRSKSGEEQQKIAKQMCHSIVSQQGSYYWLNKSDKNEN